MGRIVHEVLQRLYEAGAFDRLVSLDDALAQYDAAWEKLSRAPIEVSNENLGVEDYIKSGRKMLEDFYARHQPFNEGYLIGVESIVNFVLPGTLIPMTVKIDRLWKRPDGVVEIVDYKTGRYLPRGPQDNKFFDQMGLYQLGVQTTWPQYEQVELVQPYLALDETIRHFASQDELEELTERIRSTIMEMRHAEKLEEFPTQEGSHCSYCDYAHICPAKRHERILQEEEEAGAGEEATGETAKRLAADYLKLDTESKRLNALKDALKEDLKKLSMELGMTRFVCDEGEVTVKPSVQDKFVTRSGEPERFAELTHLAHTFGLDDYFTLDVTALMKEVMVKRRLDDDKLKQLEQFVERKESATVRVKLNQDEEETTE
jgi:CRISPR/Cas system-associated exonuclease Cas4 (RecB family)